MEINGEGVFKPFLYGCFLDSVVYIIPSHDSWFVVKSTNCVIENCQRIVIR